MPLSAVLDSTILVSAFLTPGGAADAVLQHGIDDWFVCCLSEAILFVCCLSEAILEETTRRLHSPRLQNRYHYTQADIIVYETLLRTSFMLYTDLPVLAGAVRDPNDDMVVACAVASVAAYVVTRDHDLLSMETYQGIVMIGPEAFPDLLRRMAQENPHP